MTSRRRSAFAALFLFATPAAYAAAPPPAAKGLECPTTVAVKETSKGDPKAREAAQRGLEYLSRSSQKWTSEHKCFGCHVQAVTLEALTVGRHHQYDIAPKDVQAMVDALKLGVTAGGRTTGVAFEGSAWARYDQWVDDKQTAELLKYADELTRMQGEDGSIPDDDARKPITGGTMHTTYQAAQAWRQAYARTANDKWLPPIRKAEAYLSGQASHWSEKDKTYLQDINFALLGLVAAGVGSGEASSMRLQKILLSRQHHDGGWGLDGEGSDAFATGQTLYALKSAGLSDGDPAITRGMAYLVAKQDKDGAWRTYRSGQGGAEKGEGMWAVLGLVSVDVMSVAVRGVVDGQHVAETMTIDVEARDNKDGGLSKVELFVDDLPVKEVCGAKLSYAWNTASLPGGKHIVDAVATNVKGKQSRRRFEVYAGDTFLTGVGTRFDENKQATEVTVRNIAPTKETAGNVELQVFTLKDEATPDKRIFSAAQQGAPGAMTFRWEGKGSDGKPQPRGRYLAQLVFKDAKGREVQKETALFFHDSERVQREKFGEVEGKLSFNGGAADSANTLVELVDDQGRVVQSTRSTEQGNYRFKNVDKGQYKIRAKKEGRKDLEASVESTPAAAPAKASMSW
jgi:hypothetical protein